MRFDKKKHPKKIGPASSKWPFDHPTGDHLTPEKVTLNTPKRSLFEEPGGKICLVEKVSPEASMIPIRQCSGGQPIKKPKGWHPMALGQA